MSLQLTVNQGADLVSVIQRSRSGNLSTCVHWEVVFPSVFMSLVNYKDVLVNYNT